MYLCGFSLNNLTMMALTISTGFVVDDAIVMIENISRYLEEGDTPLEAALKGSGQIGFTIVSLTISLLAVLIPLLFMGDVVGRLFRQFAVTLAVTIVISAIVSLTLVPMLCAKILRHHRKEDENKFSRKTGEMFERIIENYGRWLNWVLDRRVATLLVAVATLVLTIILYIIIPKGFFPIQDTGLIQGISEASQSVSFAAMGQRQQALGKKILEDPAVESLSSFIGVDGTNTTLNSGRFLINLKKHGTRDDVQTVIARLQNSVRDVTGIQLYMQPVQDLTIEDRVSRTQYQFTLGSPNLDDLNTWTPKLVDKLNERKELSDVASDLQSKGLQAYLDIDRDTAGRLGITPAAIDQILYDAFGQRLISTIYTESNQYRVVLEVLPEMQNGPKALSKIYIPGLSNANSVAQTSQGSTASAGNASASSAFGGTPQGATPGVTTGLTAAAVSNGQLPLDTVTTLSERAAPLSISHLGQFPATTVSFNLAQGLFARRSRRGDQASRNRFENSRQHQHQFPGRRARVSGLAHEHGSAHPRRHRHDVHRARRAVRKLHPSDHDSVHAAFCRYRCAARADDRARRSRHRRHHRHHSADRHREEKRDHDGRLRARRRTQSRHGAARRNLSGDVCCASGPILMTTLAALFGALPLMLGTGVGSELRHPLGITIVGGMIVSQVLTLFTTPVIYLSFDNMAMRVRKRFNLAEPEMHHGAHEGEATT